MVMQFKKATKQQARLRLAIYGPSGAGKTFTSLRVASGIGGRVAVIDSERGSAAKYADRFDFDALELVGDRTIDAYVEGIHAAASAGYNVLVIDSLSHAWAELLEEIDRIAKTKFKGNSWSAWSEGTPKQKALIDAVMTFPGHVIATMRSKTEWAKNEGGGKKAPERVGLAPEQGKGIEYEFDMLMSVSVDHVAHIEKDRTGKFQDKTIDKPGEEFGKALAAWLADGAPVVASPLKPAPSTPPKADERKAKALKWIEGHLSRMSEFVKEPLEAGSDEQQGTREALKTLLENEAKQLAALEAVDAGYFLAVRALDSDTECRVNGLTYEPNEEEGKAIGQLMADFGRASQVPTAA